MIKTGYGSSLYNRNAKWQNRVLKYFLYYEVQINPNTLMAKGY